MTDHISFFRNVWFSGLSLSIITTNLDRFTASYETIPKNHIHTAVGFSCVHQFALIFQALNSGRWKKRKTTIFKHILSINCCLVFNVRNSSPLYFGKFVKKIYYMATIVRALWLAAERARFSCNDRALWKFFSARRLFWVLSKSYERVSENNKKYGQSTTIFSITERKTSIQMLL